MGTSSANFRIIILSAILLISISIALAFSKLPKTSKTTLATPNLTPTTQSQTPQEVKEYLNTIYEGKTEFSGVNNGVKFSLKSYEIILPDGKITYLNVTSYLYYPGATLKEGYEGIEWERSLDKEVKGFNKLKPGTFITNSLSSVFGGDTGYSAVTAKGVEKNIMFASIDSYFQPSASYYRRYTIWLKDTNQLVEISVYPPYGYEDVVSQDVCYEDKCGMVAAYPKFFEDWLLELENSLYH